MTNRDISRNLLPVEATLRDAIVRLNEGVLGAVFLVDGGGVMRGLMTDGDVRRALIAGASLEVAASDHMNSKFVSARWDRPRDELLTQLSRSIRHLPILDADGRPVDMLCWVDVWRLPISEPALGGREFEYVKDCLATNWISSQGAYVSRFERAFADWHDMPHALATTSGTTALHLALVALGVGAGDEVLLPDVTFGASANAIIHAGAKPVFVDIDRKTWTMDPADAGRRVTARTKAMMPVHLYGHPCDMNPLLELARRHDLLVVEDCAESLGALYKGRKTGTLGHVGCFSFFANKVITTGEGGMVVTPDARLHERMLRLRDHGMSRNRRYWHEEAGFNYRMTNLQGAIGLAQLERLDALLEHRTRLADRYAARLSGLEGIVACSTAPWATNIHWLYVALVDDASLPIDREEIADRLAEHGIETRYTFPPLHNQPAYKPYATGSFPVSDWLGAKGLCLPMGNTLSLEQVDDICDRVAAVLSYARLLRRNTTRRASS